MHRGKEEHDIIVLPRNSEKVWQVAISQVAVAVAKACTCWLLCVGNIMLSAAICRRSLLHSSRPSLTSLSRRARAQVCSWLSNYSGDIIDFEMAQDMAEMEGIRGWQMLLSMMMCCRITFTRRSTLVLQVRFLYIRFLGHAACRNREWNQGIGWWIGYSDSYIGLALSRQQFLVGKPGFILADDEIEFGIGIHGEPWIYHKENADCLKIGTELVEEWRLFFELKQAIKSESP